jgi:epoxyqueuosine reductase
LKHSAQASGIGCIDKNTLLINEKYGNRLYLGAVNQKKCREACASTTDGGGFVYSCNTCRRVCPFAKI